MEGKVADHVTLLKTDVMARCGGDQKARRTVRAPTEVLWAEKPSSKPYIYFGCK